MPRMIEPQRFRDLIRLLDGLTSLHDELLSALQRKSDAMRQADLVGMREAGQREQELVQRIRERDGLRRSITDAIGEQLGLPVRTGRMLTATQLAQRVTEPQRRSILEAADRLREMMNRVVKVNRRAGAVARGVLEHFRALFTSIACSDETAPGYAGDGGRMQTGANRILNMIG